MVYEILNLYILLNSFTEKLAFSGNGEGIIRRQKASLPKSVTIHLWTILYESLAIKSCHMYQVLISLANYCHDFSVSAGLFPYSRRMVLTCIKHTKTGFKAYLWINLSNYIKCEIFLLIGPGLKLLLFLSCILQTSVLFIRCFWNDNWLSTLLRAGDISESGALQYGLIHNYIKRADWHIFLSNPIHIGLFPFAFPPGTILPCAAAAGCPRCACTSSSSCYPLAFLVWLHKHSEAFKNI